MLLFTPGPTPVPQNVRNAMSHETMHHRTPEFEALKLCTTVLPNLKLSLKKQENTFLIFLVPKR